MRRLTSSWRFEWPTLRRTCRFTYASYFSVRARDFDLQAMCKGKEACQGCDQEINSKGHDATNKEKTTLVELEIANEMLERLPF